MRFFDIYRYLHKKSIGISDTRISDTRISDTRISDTRISDTRISDTLKLSPIRTIFSNFVTVYRTSHLLDLQSVSSS